MSSHSTTKNLFLLLFLLLNFILHHNRASAARNKQPALAGANDEVIAGHLGQQAAQKAENKPPDDSGNSAPAHSKKTDPNIVRIGVLVENISRDGHTFQKPTYETSDAMRAIKASFGIFQNFEDILPNTNLQTVQRYVRTDNGFDALQSACELSKEGIASFIVVAGCTVSVTLRSYIESLEIPTLLIHTSQCNIQSSVTYSFEQTIAAAKNTIKRKGGAAQIMNYGEFWYGIGSGYTKTMNEALTALVSSEGVTRIIFYTDSIHWPQVNSFASNAGFGLTLDYFVIQHYPLNPYGQLDKEVLYQQFESMNLDQFQDRMVQTFIVLYIPLQDALELISVIAAHETFSKVQRRYVLPSPHLGNYNLEALIDFAEKEDIIIVRQNIPRSKDVKRFILEFCKEDSFTEFSDTRCHTTDPTEKPLVAYWLYDGIHHLLKSISRIIKAKKWQPIRQGQVQCGINNNYKNSNRWKGGSSLMAEIKKFTSNGLLGHMAIDANSENSGVKLEILEKKFNEQAFVSHELTDFTKFNESKFSMPTMDNFRGLDKDKKYLKGMKFNVVTIREEPFVEVRTNQETGITEFSGFLIDFFNELKDLLGFEYHLYEVKDGKYGVEQPDGNWNGMIGDILNNTAHIALAAMTITAARDHVVDFTIRYKDYSVGILMKRPKTGVNLWAFFGPFELPVWICIILSTFLVGGVLAVLTRISSNLFNRGYDDPPPKKILKDYKKSSIDLGCESKHAIIDLDLFIFHEK